MTQNRISLPIFGLIAFALAGFTTIMTEVLPAGLLQQISANYSISDSLSGQMVSIYALGSTISVVPLVMLTKSWSRKSALILAMSGLLVFNSLTAFSDNFTLSLAYRFIAGMAAGLVWGVLTGYIRGLVEPKDQGKALAIACIGQPVALAVGIPLAATLAGFFDWRWIFGFMSILSAVFIIWLLLGVPNVAGTRATEKRSVFHVLTVPGVVTVLAVLFLWILAHNMLYIYISSYLAFIGLVDRLGVVLFIFGASAIVSIFFIGTQIDRRLRVLTVGSLAVFALICLFLSVVMQSMAGLYISVALWGLTFGGAPALLQTALADAAGDEADIAQSFFVTLFNLAIAAAGRAGGLVLDCLNAGYLPVFAFLSVAVACLLAFLSRKAAFKSGHRMQHKNA